MFNPKTLLSVKNLVTEFHTEDRIVKAVNDVSFDVNKGETIGIVGESGSGKSVTSLSAMRLIPSPPGKIAGGTIEFQNKRKKIRELTTVSEEEMRKLRGNEIAMIFQEPMTSLNPVYTCGNQVQEAIVLHQRVSKAEAKRKTIELFKKVQLPRPDVMFDTYPHQISGGQKQRVMIAMAMSCTPSVLIADEPTTALDVTVQKTILELMGELQREFDMGIIFITHDLGVIAELADRVVVMYKGKIVEQGTAWEIFSNPQHPYTKGLLACRPPLDQRLRRLPTVADFVDMEGGLKAGNRTVEQVVHDLVEPASERKARIDTMLAKEPVLKVRNLNVKFPIKKNFFGRATSFVHAVNEVSFDVYPGETLGLVGESGCGKTTLGRTILRLVEPTSGEILYNGDNLATLGKKALRGIRKDLQIIFQDPYSSLNPRITIGEAIIEPMRVHEIGANDAERKEKAVELLKRVNMLEEHYGRYPHEFSGGQRQRICIARALALSPQFIICDESVSALDVSVQAQVLNLLKELQEEFGFTYIFISHDLSVVKYMSDRMIVMNNGRIEELGDADEIYANPSSEYTSKLISAIPKGRLEDIEAAMAVKKARLAEA